MMDKYTFEGESFDPMEPRADECVGFLIEEDGEESPMEVCPEEFGKGRKYNFVVEGNDPLFKSIEK